jgi:DNA-directed RNA polymerase specialized sigma24 family protein
MSHERDLAFVESILQGDAQAFGAFFEQSFARVHAYALRRCATAEAAQWATTAVMSAIVARLDCYTGRVSLDTWVFAHARSLTREKGGDDLPRAEVGGLAR